jgi:hypothetical protein
LFENSTIHNTSAPHKQGTPECEKSYGSPDAFGAIECNEAAEYFMLCGGHLFVVMRVGILANQQRILQEVGVERKVSI